MCMAEEPVTLSNQEARDLVLTIFEVLDAIEDGEVLRGSWATEMRDWIVLILSRMEGGGA